MKTATTMPRKYLLPLFLHDKCDWERYSRWLRRKAIAHCKRDRRRGNATATVASYKRAIHDAVTRSEGLDAYAGRPLRWDLISKYDNAAAAAGRRKIKAKFAELPTVDHTGDGRGAPDFQICAWQTNDAKNDLSYEDFVALCRAVLKHHDRR